MFYFNSFPDFPVHPVLAGLYEFCSKWEVGDGVVAVILLIVVAHGTSLIDRIEVVLTYTCP